MNISHENRLNLELDVCKKVIQDALAAGYFCRVYDGEEWATSHTNDEAVLVEALRSTDEDYIYFFHIKDKPAGSFKGWRTIGFAQFVYGNMPYEVIADNTDTDDINNLLKGAEALQDEIEKELT